MSIQGQRILVVDLGSTNCKSYVFRLGGQIEHQVSAAIRTYRPAPGWSEQDPQDWWSAVVKTVRRLVARQEFNMTHLAAIAVTGQMHAVVAVGEDGEPLGRSATSADRRSVKEVQEILRFLSLEESHALTGARLDAFAPAAKIAWLRHNEPTLYHRTRVFLPPKDFIRYRLTGTIATDPIDAAGTLLFDIRQRTWADSLLEAAKIEPSKLPPIREPTEIAGCLTTSAAAQLNLPSGIPVAIGAGDDIEFLGAGVIEPGMALEHLGTTGSINVCLDHIPAQPSLTLDVYPGVGPDLWFIGGSTSNAGSALLWGQKLLYGQPTQSGVWGRLWTAWRPSLAQPLLFLPYLEGERCPIWDPHAVGILLGLTGQHTRDDVMRSIFVGVAFALRHILEAIEGTGVSVRAITVMDGSGFDWAHIRGSVYNKTMLLVNVQDPTALGSMLLAGVAIGAFEDPFKAVKEIVSMARVVEPVEEFAEPFSQLYEMYKRTYILAQSALAREWKGVSP